MKFLQKMPLFVFYTMVQKSQKWPKTQIKGGPALISYSEIDQKKKETIRGDWKACKPGGRKFGMELFSYTVIAQIFVRNLISYISYFWQKVRNLVAHENHTRMQVFLTPPTLYENF